MYFCFFKQKPAYEMRISDWSSDVCSSDLRTLQPRAELVERVARTIIDGRARGRGGRAVDSGRAEVDVDLLDQLGIELLVRIERVIARIVERDEIGRASCRERVCQYV